MGRLLTTEQAAEFLQVHPGTLRRKARAGRVPCVRMERQFRFDVDVLREWLAAGCPTRAEQPSMFDQATPGRERVVVRRMDRGEVAELLEIADEEGRQ